MMYGEFLGLLQKEDFSELNMAMRDAAMNGLKSILRESAAEIEFMKGHTVDQLSFEDSLSINLTGKYSSPVFAMRIKIYGLDREYLGWYEYITDLQMRFVDEFLVSS